MIRIIDNFFTRPDEIRDYALKSSYDLISIGNYPGKDSLEKLYMPPELKSDLSRIFPDPRYAVICSRFRWARKGDPHMSYIHADNHSRKAGWHVLIYLTKNPPIKDGISLYKTPDGRKVWADEEDDPLDEYKYPEWQKWCEVEYVYNRAVILDYSYFHAPMNKESFGDNIDDSRLLLIIEIIDTNSPANKNRIFKTCITMSKHKHPYSRDDDNEPLAWSETDIASYERIENLENGVVVD